MYLYHLSKPIMRTQSDRYKGNYVTNQILKTVIYRKSSKFIGQISGCCFWNSHLGPISLIHRVFLKRSLFLKCINYSKD